jgi:hypothetical protein
MGPLYPEPMMNLKSTCQNIIKTDEEKKKKAREESEEKADLI